MPGTSQHFLRTLVLQTLRCTRHSSNSTPPSRPRSPVLPSCTPPSRQCRTRRRTFGSLAASDHPLKWKRFDDRVIQVYYHIHLSFSLTYEAPWTLLHNLDAEGARGVGLVAVALHWHVAFRQKRPVHAAVVIVPAKISEFRFRVGS